MISFHLYNTAKNKKYNHLRPFMNLINKEVMHVGEMASGAALTVPVYRMTGAGAGPNVYP